jgi:hypothetical protein
MQMNSKNESKAIQIVNNEPILTLQVDKKRLAQLARTTMVAIIAALLSIMVVAMYLTNHVLFEPLCKAYLLIALVATPAIYFKSFK